MTTCINFGGGASVLKKLLRVFGGEGLGHPTVLDATKEKVARKHSLPVGGEGCPKDCVGGVGYKQKRLGAQNQRKSHTNSLQVKMINQKGGSGEIRTNTN